MKIQYYRPGADQPLRGHSVARVGQFRPVLPPLQFLNSCSDRYLAPSVVSGTSDACSALGGLVRPGLSHLVVRIAGYCVV